MATVKEIAPHALQPEHLRVAAYCRVSSDSEDQLHSYAAQIRNYTEVIAQHDGWDLVDVYADEGLTGTRVDKRDDFNRMMRDCRKGKIDCILVKSVARFARNTKECLASLRELSGMGVTVRFEKENIDTGTLTTELMVSVSGSLAQQESLSEKGSSRFCVNSQPRTSANQDCKYNSCSLVQSFIEVRMICAFSQLPDFLFKRCRELMRRGRIVILFYVTQI